MRLFRKIFLLLLCGYFNQAKSIHIDSLKLDLSNLSGIPYIDQCLQIGEFEMLQNSNCAELKVFSIKALDSSIALGEHIKELQSLQYLGIASLECGELDKSEKYLLQALNKSISYKEPSWEADCYNKLGTLYERMNLMDKAIDMYTQSSVRLKKLGDYNALSLAYGNIINIFINENQPDRVKHYLQKLAELESRLNYSKETSRDIFLFYKNLGYGWTFIQPYDEKGFDYLSRALNLAEENQFDFDLVLILVKLVEHQYQKGNLTEAKNLLQKADQYELKDNKYGQISLGFIGTQVYEKLGELQGALKYISLVNDNESLVVINESYIKYLSSKINVLKKLDKKEQVIETYDILYKVLNTFNDSTRIKAINELEEKYNRTENELEINKLNAEKLTFQQEQKIKNLQVRSLIGFLLASALALAILIFFYRQSGKRAALKIAETEQRLNRARMNPHFFFNALSVIQTQAVTNKQTEIATLVSNFAKLMRRSLETTYDDFVSLEDEVEFLNQYLRIQLLRFPNKFTFHFILDDQIDTSEVRMPSMLLQPFLENSIEHGFKAMESGGVINIHFLLSQNTNRLKIVIDDNGNSLAPSDSDKSHKSRANEIVSDRIFLLQKLLKKEVLFQIRESGNLGGYTVEIDLPAIY